MYKNIFILFGVILLPTILVAKTLEISTIEYPPYEYTENGVEKGIAVELVKEGFKRIKQPIELKFFPWARAIKAVQDGTTDALFTAYKKPERELFADYSKEILLVQNVSLFVHKDSKISFDGNLASMNKYKFGLVRKFSYGPIFDAAREAKKVTQIQLANTVEQNVQKLIKKRYDIFVNDKYSAFNTFNKLGISNEIKELSPPVQSLNSHIIFSKKRNLAHIRDKFDKALASMKKDGTYDQIIKNFFK